MVGSLHDLPCVSPSIDVTAPGERLIANAQTSMLCSFGHLCQIRGGTAVVIDRSRVRVAAHQDQIGAERLHHVELAFGSVHVAAALRFRHRLEIAERLEDGDSKAKAIGDGTDILGRTIEGQEIVLEHLDAVEADCGGGFQLFWQRAAE